MSNPTFAIDAIVEQKPDKIVENIHFYEREDYNTWFEEEYNRVDEPWDYTKRGGELLRHSYSVEQIKKYKPNPEILLELGCSKGLMTQHLLSFTKTVVTTDISPTALHSCKKRCEPIAKNYNHNIKYFGTSTPGLPFIENSFDVVTVCDGLYGWWFSAENKKLALEDINRVLKKNGIAILTDCIITGELQEEYFKMIDACPMTVKKISYLYDKPWFKLESLFKKLHIDKLFKGIIASITIAKLLNSFGSLFGRKASYHIVVILEKS